MTQTFSHSGDFGDIIYSLPTIRAAGGGVLRLFHSPGKTAHGMSEEKVGRIRPLLLEQEYIEDVIWSPHGPDHGLNGFRHHRTHGNLADMHLATHGLGWEHRIKAWLTVSNPRPEYPVVIARSPRYQNGGFPWSVIVDKYAGQIGFVGFESEHREFINAFGNVPFVEANDLLEVARLIAGCKLFVGNYTGPHAIAHGLKHTMIQEVPPDHNHHLCIYSRMNCINGWDGKIELPDL